MSGPILETWILTEILKGCWHNGLRAPFYFCRGKDGKEIDLLIELDGTLYPVEFKKTASPRRDDVKHFQALGRMKMPVGPGGVICLARESLPPGVNARSIPVSAV